MATYRTAAVAAVLAVLGCTAASAQDAEVRVSDLIVRLGEGAAWDVGEGALVAGGTADVPEADPALRSSIEARRRALARLRVAALNLPFDAGTRVRDLPEAWRDRLLAGLEAAPIVGEWREGEGRLVAAASLPTCAGHGSLLSLLLGVGAQPPSGAADPRPVLIAALDSAIVIRPCLLPRIALPEGSACFADAREALLRGGTPVRWFGSRESAVRTLPDGQRALEVTATRGEGGEVRLTEAAARELARCGLAADYTAFAEVRVVAPGLDLSTPVED